MKNQYERDLVSHTPGAEGDVRAKALDCIRKLQRTNHATDRGLDFPNFCDVCGSGWRSNAGSRCSGDRRENNAHRGVVTPLVEFISTYGRDLVNHTPGEKGAETGLPLDGMMMSASLTDRGAADAGGSPTLRDPRTVAKMETFRGDLLAILETESLSPSRWEALVAYVEGVVS